MRTLWVLIEPDDQVENTLALGGDALREALVEFNMSVTMDQIGEMGAVIGEQISRGFAPASKMNPPSQEGGGAPLEPTSSATAPAGS